MTRPNHLPPLSPHEVKRRKARRRKDRFETVALGTAVGGVILLWVAGVVLSLGLIGVAIWAVIKLVLHFTGS